MYTLYCRIVCAFSFIVREQMKLVKVITNRYYKLAKSHHSAEQFYSMNKVLPTGFLTCHIPYNKKHWQ